MVTEPVQIAFGGGGEGHGERRPRGLRVSASRVPRAEQAVPHPASESAAVLAAGSHAEPSEREVTRKPARYNLDEADKDHYVRSLELPALGPLGGEKPSPRPLGRTAASLKAPVTRCASLSADKEVRGRDHS